MKFATTSLAALIALLLLPASTSARSWQHADLETSPPRTVAILPPLASITRGHVNEAEPMIKETQALESAVAAHAVEFLTKLGYTVDRHALSTDACSSDRELQAAVVQVQSRVDELLPTMSEKPKSIREGRYSIGETAVPVATASKADALIALRASAVVPSKGARALTGVLSGIFNLIPMVPTTHTELIAVVIDGKTGLVEGLFVGVEGGPVLKDPDRVGTRVVDEAFMDYPRPG
jgi:hypothetical protein